ncbi:MAG: hypothetical protein KC620_10195, partial [Myxococcales bacterium]|nr:hypothetical protein [Myxococcales bacterium]
MLPATRQMLEAQLAALVTAAGPDRVAHFRGRTMPARRADRLYRALVNHVPSPQRLAQISGAPLAMTSEPPMAMPPPTTRIDPADLPGAGPPPTTQLGPPMGLPGPTTQINPADLASANPPPTTRLETAMGTPGPTTQLNAADLPSSGPPPTTELGPPMGTPPPTTRINPADLPGQPPPTTQLVPPNGTPPPTTRLDAPRDHPPPTTPLNAPRAAAPEDIDESAVEGSSALLPPPSEDAAQRPPLGSISAPPVSFPAEEGTGAAFMLFGPS